jgi:hypothetical protein
MVSASARQYCGGKIMKLRAIIAVLALVFAASINCFSASPAGPDGWQTIKDKTGVCQISIPSNWSAIPSMPGQFASPEHIASVLLASHERAHATMTDEQKRVYGADKMIENTADLWLYASKPNAQNIITYHVNVPISGHVCLAEITVKVGHSEDEIKKIAATVGAAK